MKTRLGLLIAVMALVSCRSDPRMALRDSLAGADVRGYDFSLTETDSGSVAAFTNPAWRTFGTISRRDPATVIRYTRLQDKRGAVTTYRAEVVSTAAGASLRVTDLATNTVVLDKPFVRARDLAEVCDFHDETYDSVAACEADFDCTCRPALQCEANRTCDPIVIDQECCITGQEVCTHALLLIVPNTRRCALVESVPDQGGFVLTQD